MYYHCKPIAISIQLSLISSVITVLPAFAQNQSSSIEEIEVITISHQRHHVLGDNSLGSNLSFAQGKTTEVDLASWLASVPGANINSNGPITGIAQYRGLYGDRISTTLDGHPVIGAGPNAMDTPLSYSTPLIVDSMKVYRGIAPVSAGMNTLGGAIDVKMRKAEVNNTNKIQVTGDLQAGYRSNNQASTLSGVTNVGQGDVALLLYGNSQAGDSMESGDDTLISPTDFDKVQAGFDLRRVTQGNEYNASSDIGLSYHYTHTTDSGTPALPMDIEYIKSHRMSINGRAEIGLWQTAWALGYLDADHEMTNFLMRPNDNPHKYRRNTALADTTDFKLTISREFTFGELSFGVDGYFAKHDSVITNPNNKMFKIINFNGVEDNRFALFGEWHQKMNNTLVQLGARLKHAQSNANEVSSSMAISMGDSSTNENSSMSSDMNSGMGLGIGNTINSKMKESVIPAMHNMGMLARSLQDDFNNADRNVSDTNVDIALSTQTHISEHVSLYFGVGVKNRAPSYQERYLWTPMEATGGLADGHTYIGDINLASEKAYQTDIGLTWQSDRLMVSPHVFYQHIDDYIQGTPITVTDSSAKMMASMMTSDDNPLKFSNVDAKLYGVDVNWSYSLTKQLQLSGLASYVQGERRDINDNLYRIAPLNGQMRVSYYGNALSTSITFVAVSSQHDVSITNGEKATSGYGVVNIDVEYYVNTDFTLRAGFDNLLDREYQNHLGGYNRVKELTTPVMSRLASEGLSAWFEATYSF
jgi:iron complex outermembrane receptor protein